MQDTDETTGRFATGSPASAFLIEFQRQLVTLVGQWSDAAPGVGIARAELTGFAGEQILHLVSLERLRKDHEMGALGDTTIDQIVTARRHDLLMYGLLLAMAAANRTAMTGHGGNGDIPFTMPMRFATDAVREIMSKAGGEPEIEPVWIARILQLAEMPDDMRAAMMGAAAGRG